LPLTPSFRRDTNSGALAAAVVMKFLFLSFALMVSGAAVPAAEQAIIKTTYADIHGWFKMTLDCFSNDCGRYPTTSEGFKALLVCPTNIPAEKWHGPYFDPPKIPQDLWKHDYVYRCPGVHNTNGYDLYSCGFDGISKSGGDDLDDINNWDPDSPHGGTDYYLSYSDELIDKFVSSPAFPVFFRILPVISFLGGVWMIAAIFFRHVRAYIVRHPVAHFIWLIVWLAAIFLFLSSIPHISSH
jgi:type II secretion system protein G